MSDIKKERKPRSPHKRETPCAHGRLICAYCPSDKAPPARPPMCPVCNLERCEPDKDACSECSEAGLEAGRLFSE